MFTCHTLSPTRVDAVDVEVLDKPIGDVALQTQIGDDTIAAVVVSSPRTWYRFHLPFCKGAFSATQLRRKVRQ